MAAYTFLSAQIPFNYFCYNNCGLLCFIPGLSFVPSQALVLNIYGTVLLCESTVNVRIKRCTA